MCLTLKAEKKVDKKFRTRWNVLRVVGALDRKHIAMKKPKKSGRDYYNYKGFFSLVLLGLVDAEYRFLWVNAGSSGSSSDTHIFNQSNLWEKIEDSTFVLLPPEPLGEMGQSCTISCWVMKASP